MLQGQDLGKEVAVEVTRFLARPDVAAAVASLYLILKAPHFPPTHPS